MSTAMPAPAYGSMLRWRSGGVITIEGNLFKDNSVGVTNSNGVALDATYNSWGCYTGPGTSVCDTVVGLVTYVPFTFSEMYIDVDPPNDPGTVNRLEGESFDVNMSMDAWNITGVEIDFTYDDTKLTLNSITFPSPWTFACFPLAALPNQVHYYCSLVVPAPGYSATDLAIATLNFTAEDNGGLTGLGPWSAIFDVDPVTTNSSTVGGAKVFVNNAGYGTPETRALIDDANDGQIDITGTGQFAGFIDLQGRSNDTGGTLTVYDGNVIGSATALAATSSNSAGSYTTSSIGPAFLGRG